MTALVASIVVAVLLGIALGIVKSRQDREAADKTIEDAFDHSVRRADLGIPTIPIEQIYTERQ